MWQFLGHRGRIRTLTIHRGCCDWWHNWPQSLIFPSVCTRGKQRSSWQNTSLTQFSWLWNAYTAQNQKKVSRLIDDTSCLSWMQLDRNKSINTEQWKSFPHNILFASFLLMCSTLLSSRPLVREGSGFGAFWKDLGLLWQLCIAHIGSTSSIPQLGTSSRGPDGEGQSPHKAPLKQKPCKKTPPHFFPFLFTSL